MSLEKILNKARSSLRRVALTGVIGVAWVGGIREARGEIVYTDIPDTTVTFHNRNYEFDINNNLPGGIFGIKIDTWMEVGWEVALSSNLTLSGDSEVVGSGGYDKWVSVLSKGDIIGPNSNFTEGLRREAFLFHRYAGGEWKGKSKKYVGVNFFSDNNIYYGWIKLSVSDTTGNYFDYPITVHDYAYENIPNTSIKAGLPAPQFYAVLFGNNNGRYHRSDEDAMAIYHVLLTFEKVKERACISR